ncbi:MAG: AsmA-like C-terminal region-containing protein [Candidatus Krumholzibacteria bacterium]
MKKRLLVIGITLAVLTGGVVILLLNLEGLVNRNKDFLIGRAEGVLGRTITVEKIGVTLRGGIGVRLENFAVADDPGFSSEPFLRAAELQVNAKLLPLLRKEFEVKRVTLRDPVIRIIRNREGQLNVNAFAPGGGGGPQSPPASTDPQSASPAAFVISLVNLDGGELVYLDQAQGLELRITDMNSKVQDIDLTNPISLELEAALFSEKKNLTLRATFGPIGENPQNMHVEATATLGPVDFGAAAAALPQLGGALPQGFEISGPVKLTAAVEGSLPDLGITLDVDATGATIRGADGFHKSDGVPLSLRGTLQADAGKYLISDLEVLFHTLKVSGNGEFVPGKIPSLVLTAASEPTSLDGWAAVFPAMEPYQLAGRIQFHVQVKGPISDGKLPTVGGTATLRGGSARLPQQPKPLQDIRADITFTDREAEIKNVSLKIGDSRIDGEATVVRFNPLTVDYRANSAALALVDVKLPNPAAKKPEVMNNVVVQGRMRVSKDKTPVNRGKISTGSGSVANFDYRDLSGKYSIEGNVIDLTDIQAKTLDGSLTGSGRVVMDKTSPSFSFESKARNLNLLQVFEALPGVARKHVRGKANFDLKISGNGKDWNSIQKTVAGDGVAEFFAGEIIGTNMFSNIVDQLAAITGRSDWVSQNVRDKYPKVFKSADTAFKEFKSTFVIEGGKLKARNVTLDAGDYAMLGKGELDLSGGLNLAVTLTVSQGLSADLVSGFSAASLLRNDQGQIEIPFLLTGRLPDVKAKPRPDFVQSVLEKALLNKGLDLFGKDRSNLEDLKKDGLKKLLDFGKKKKPAAPADTTSAP